MFGLIVNVVTLPMIDRRSRVLLYLLFLAWLLDHAA